MATDAILETIKPRRSQDEQLPVTTAAGGGNSGGIGLRRRMSSFSVHLGPSLSSAGAVAFRRAQSMPSVKAGHVAARLLQGARRGAQANGTRREAAKGRRAAGLQVRLRQLRAQLRRRRGLTE